MNSTVLTYESDPKVYEIQSEHDPCNEIVAGLEVSEHFQKSDTYKHISYNIGDYHVVIKTEVHSSSEIQSMHFEIQDLIRGIDQAWMYACGHPLNKKVLSYMGPYVNFPDGNIPGWKSNYREAEKEVNKGRAHVTFGFKKISHSTFSYWPLKSALITRESYLSASEPIKALIDLHYFAHKVDDSYSSFFFIAKSLEIVRALLPGKTDEQKEKEFPDEVRSRLKTSLHDIIGLANTRYEIRHIIKDKKNISLHKRMNKSEINSFKHDADLIIRYVACNNLQISLIIPERG
ncbi:hypothetical protein [Desulfobacter postgatei]|uniref:hypothetical protein n=1 Tax=Desulfobacter postgatei TaxID=2293 RepID=UPI00259BAD34|nr:hypothetical protein [uncultured Desulfobacter sp.]